VEGGKQKACCEIRVTGFGLRILIQWDPVKVGLTAEKLDEAMAAEDPPVFLKERHNENYSTNKAWRMIDIYFLREGEKEIIVQRLNRIMAQP